MVQLVLLCHLPCRCPTEVYGLLSEVNREMITYMTDTCSLMKENPWMAIACWWCDVATAFEEFVLVVVEMYRRSVPVRERNLAIKW